MTPSRDAAIVRTLVDSFSTDWLVQERIRDNITGPGSSFQREEFWHVLLGCLLTTQQRSTKGMPVPRFLEEKPFPLSLKACGQQNKVQQFVLRTLTNYGGIRRTSIIARQAEKNYTWLQNGGWSKIQSLYEALSQQRQREPHTADKNLERQAARDADQWFAGIGPKQSRNLWQWLGLTRYEIPLDSRLSDWVNSNLSFNIDAVRLGFSEYYEEVLDRLQAVCAEAGVLPCIFDAAAFNYENRAVTAQTELYPDKQTETRGSKTTAPGYVNKNGQVTIRDTGMPGTDHFQRVYQLACSHCGHVYGANGSDIHERNCPRCQGGAEGLPLKVAHHA